VCRTREALANFANFAKILVAMVTSLEQLQMNEHLMKPSRWTNNPENLVTIGPVIFEIKGSEFGPSKRKNKEKTAVYIARSAGRPSGLNQ